MTRKVNNKIFIDGVCSIRLITKSKTYELDAGLKLGGPRKYRRRFKSKEEALKHASELNNKLKEDGLSAFSLSRDQTIDASKGLKILAGHATIEKACRFFMRFQNSEDPDINIAQLVDSFFEFKKRKAMLGEKGASTATLEDYNQVRNIIERVWKTPRDFIQGG